MGTEDKGGQCRYRETVDIVDTHGKWIQRIHADSGCRETVDIVDAQIPIYRL